GLHFDPRLRGAGAQVHNDMGFSLSVKRAGWKLIYDPRVAVDHYPAPRFDEDQRAHLNVKAHRDAVHNETLILLEHLRPLQRAVFFVWAGLVGTRSAPGLLQIPRLALHRDTNLFKRLPATIAGRAAGLRAFLGLT